MEERIAKILERLCGALLVVMVALVTLQVGTRYLFRGSMLWAGEIAVWFFVWVTFMGSVVLFIRKKHIVVDLVSSLVPEKARSVLGVITSFIVLAFLIAIFPDSLTVVQSYSRQTATSIDVSKFFLFSSLPVALALMILFSAYSLVKKLRRR